jgi:hypothetical protein
MAFWEITVLGVTENSLSIARDTVCKLLVLFWGGIVNDSCHEVG